MIKYEIQEKRENENTALIVLSEGKVKGVKFRYGTINPIEDEEGDGLQLSFEYEIKDTANHIQEYLEKDEDFHPTLGDLVIQILEEKIKEEDSQ